MKLELTDDEFRILKRFLEAQNNVSWTKLYKRYIAKILAKMEKSEAAEPHEETDDGDVNQDFKT